MKVTTYIINKGTSSQYYGLKNAEENQVLYYAPNNWKTEKGESRFERLKRTHPRQYEYCIGGGEYVNGVWQPSKEGLGMGHVFDELNKIYGDGFIKY